MVLLCFNLKFIRNFGHKHVFKISFQKYVYLEISKNPF